MKKVLFSLLPFPMAIGMLLFAGTSLAQDKSDRPSPPAEATGTIGDATITISYSSPAVKERKIWGGLEKYGKVWRTGANEATVFETSADITVNGNALPAGKYGFFTIPGEETWVVIFNSVWDQWGAYKYDQSKDVLRLEVTPEEGPHQERLEFAVAGDEVVFAWEKLRFSLRVQ
jgi:hypothetical protein